MSLKSIKHLHKRHGRLYQELFRKGLFMIAEAGIGNISSKNFATAVYRKTAVRRKQKKAVFCQLWK